MWSRDLRIEASTDVERDRVKDIEEAQKRKTLFQSREDYKQKRLEKILHAKEKPESPTIEELEARPGYKEIKTRPMIQRDDNIRATASKNDYI